ncbi:sigma-70 family RNA polymerase sigma factor [Vibrio sp. SS-MA-C1-2]|uniref:sigma-70 family RNA polymerase sigma factor n=1 Tax=Vibrio sp. SS-MA-C1-2 TaxID=2908646 RepID=UPI001F23CEF9|nr:sigma-70 family RNA polymerase sigma factor [Vibrio sp. SS-MA-C1-2]UJF18039.1 sigma-70 family RNA polymerase sigma factor [Vibrio sp. SS-MA-C1-2]
MLLKQSYQQTELKSSAELMQLETAAIESHIGFVKSVLRQYSAVLDSGALEDLYQTAMMTLILEFRKFNHIDNDDFQKSVKVKIRFELINELRRQDFVERNKRKLIREINKAEMTLSQKLKRVPEHSEICAYLGIETQQFHNALNYSSIQDDTDLDQLVVEKLDDVDRELLVDEIQQQLEAMPLEAQKVMYLMFEVGLGFEEVSIALDLSIGKIQRIKEKAVKLLIAELGRRD